MTTSIDAEKSESGPEGESERPSEEIAPPVASRPRASHAPQRMFGPSRRLALFALVLLFFAALIAGRVLSPAILGWRSGIELWIARVDTAAALLGQGAVVAGSLIAIQYLIATLVESQLSVAYRLVAAPLTAGVITLVMASSTRELPVLLALGLGILSSFIALSASVPAVITERTRALGLTVGLSGLAGLMTLTARALAVWASQEALTGLFRSAQVLATLSWAIELLAFGVAIAWLSDRRWPRAAAIWLPVFAVTLAVTLAARASQTPGSVLGLVQKSLGTLVRHPWPLVPSALHFATATLWLVAIPTSLAFRTDRPLARAAIGFVLVSRAGVDIPVPALGLLLAALLAALAAARERAESVALSQRPSQ